MPEVDKHIEKRIDHIEERIDDMDSEIQKLKNEHLLPVALDIKGVKTDVDWIKKAIWLVAGASVSSFLAALFNIISQ